MFFLDNTKLICDVVEECKTQTDTQRLSSLFLPPSVCWDAPVLVDSFIKVCSKHSQCTVCFTPSLYLLTFALTNTGVAVNTHSRTH